jgi:hypothetical protein
MSSVQFPAVFEAALEEYMKKTKINIKTDPLFAKLQDCQSSDAVLDILQEQAHAFEQFREGDGKVQLMRWLKPFVRSILWLSNNDYSKESPGLVRPTRSTYLLEKFIDVYRLPCRHFHWRGQYLPVLVIYSK